VRLVLASALVATFAASAAWQLRAAQTVARREPEVFARDVAAYLTAHQSDALRFRRR
jgi:hypothetical protein